MNGLAQECLLEIIMRDTRLMEAYLVDSLQVLLAVSQVMTIVSHATPIGNCIEYACLLLNVTYDERLTIQHEAQLVDMANALEDTTSLESSRQSHKPEATANLQYLQEFNHQNPDDCVICSDTIIQQVCTLRCCGAMYHLDCIRRWLSENNKCPCCRALVVLNPPVEEERKSSTARVQHQNGDNDVVEMDRSDWRKITSQVNEDVVELEPEDWKKLTSRQEEGTDQEVLEIDPEEWRRITSPQEEKTAGTVEMFKS